MAPADPAFRHHAPADLQALLDGDPALRATWDGLTSIQRSDWICWMTEPKTQATRDKRRARLAADIVGGTRSPCCWPGCPHRLERARAWASKQRRAGS